MRKIKENLLTEICNWYNYKWEYTLKGYVLYWYVNENQEKIERTCASIEQALKEWLDTLIETNNEHPVWTEDEIKFIDEL